MEEVKGLIGSGADVNAADSFGNTALIYASSYGRKEIVEQLLLSGAEVNVFNVFENTALIWAARNGHKKMVELLLRAGADMEYKDKDAKNAIDWARQNNKQEIVKIFTDEPARREAAVKNYLAKKITEATSSHLFSDISNIIAQYAIEYKDLPLEYRLVN